MESRIDVLTFFLTVKTFVLYSTMSNAWIRGQSSVKLHDLVEEKEGENPLCDTGCAL